MLRLAALVGAFSAGATEDPIEQLRCPLALSAKQLKGHYGGFAHFTNLTDGVMAADMKFDEKPWKIELDFVRTNAKLIEMYAARVQLTRSPEQLNFVIRGIRPPESPSLIMRAGLPTASLTTASSIDRWHAAIRSFLLEDAEEDELGRYEISEANEELCSIDGSFLRIRGDLEHREEGWDTAKADNRGGSGVMEFLTSDVSPPLEGASTYFQRKPDLIGHLQISADCGRPETKLYVAARKLDPAYLGAQQALLGFFFSIKSLAEIYLYSQQFKLMSAQPVLLKTSSWMIGSAALYDAFEAQFFFSQQTRSVASMMSIAGILKILLVCVVQMRWLILLWKETAVQRFRQVNSAPDDPTGWIAEMNKGIRTSAVLMVFVLLIASNVFETAAELVLLIFALYMIPQILLNAYHGQRHPLRTTFLAGVAACRFVVPLALWSTTLAKFWRCNTYYDMSDSSNTKFQPGWFFTTPIPSEFVDLFGGVARRPNSPALTTIAVLLISQVLLLFMQGVWSPRVFVPVWISEKYLPTVFDYEMDVARAAALRQEIDPDCTGVDCVICFTGLKFADYNCVVTPCQHFFHRECLLKWMEVKLECPTCRRLLPPY